jgi:hypothetical protein
MATEPSTIAIWNRASAYSKFGICHRAYHVFFPLLRFRHQFFLPSPVAGSLS